MDRHGKGNAPAGIMKWYPNFQNKNNSEDGIVKFKGSQKKGQTVNTMLQSWIKRLSVITNIRMSIYN